MERDPQKRRKSKGQKKAAANQASDLLSAVRAAGYDPVLLGDAPVDGGCRTAEAFAALLGGDAPITPRRPEKRSAGCPRRSHHVVPCRA